MKKDNSLGDSVRFHTAKEVQQNLHGMENLFLTVERWLEFNRARNAQRVVSQNLLSSSSQYLRVAAENLSTHVSVLALATRSLYELNLRTRAILSVAGQLDDWQSEAVTDKTQVYEGILALQTTEPNSTDRNILQNEMERLVSLRAKYGFNHIKKPLDAGKLAIMVNRENEHKGLFKLFSKLVHPSSYLTNDYSDASSKTVRMILEMHAQLYAWDTFSRICQAFEVPNELRSISAST